MPRSRPPTTRSLALAALTLSVGLAGMATLGSPARADGDHVVAQGEYLGSIAARYGTTVRELVATNGLSNPNLVVPGQRLSLPASVVAEPAAADPVATAAPTTSTTTATTSTATATTEGTHTVAAGERLGDIARQYGTTVTRLVSSNAIRNPNLIRIGAVLKVPVEIPSSLPERLRSSPERLAMRPSFLRWAERYSLPADLLQATCWLESGWQQVKVSGDGAIGVCQLLPSTAAHVAWMVGEPLDPDVVDDNIRMGARYLRWLLDQTDGDVDASLAGYVQGLRSVAERGRYGETQNYIDAIQALRSRFTT